MEADAAAYLAAQYFGRASYGATYGLLYALVILGGGIGPLLASASYDRTGSYDTALAAGSALFMLSALLISLLRYPARDLADSTSPTMAAA
jgi:MFS family permease